jgi:hypothetical protein
MRAAALAAVLLVPAAASAQDRVLGTLTVEGRTTRLARVYAARQPDARDPSSIWLIVLLADRPVADHPGLPAPGAVSIDVQRNDGRRLEARLRSRVVGQAWHFDARVQATLATAGSAIVETLAEAPPAPARVEASPARAEADPAGLKKRLGALGYAFSPDELVRAIYDGNPEAVRAFLDAGLPADSRGGNGDPALLHATMSCGRGEPAAHAAIVRALLMAGAKPDVRDDNNSSPLIWAAQLCPIEAVEALLDAGADVNARAYGGATPLMMAEAMQRADVAEVLKRAGARPWRQ